MTRDTATAITWGQWMALLAALLGWLFDGLEMGLFPLVARPCLRELLGESDAVVGRWITVITAAFLIGAATGGVLFGWLGDRIGRVRAMVLSVLTYAIFSGLCGLATSAEQVAGFRFVASLGMGGEWSLGVALVMEIWPNRSRALLAGLIGAAANVGFLIISLASLVLNSFVVEAGTIFQQWGVSEAWTNYLLGNDGWRLLMMFGALPALLTFLIRVFVPESERWQHEQKKGSTSSWATGDLLGVLIGSASACGMIYLWAEDCSWPVRIVGSAVAMLITTGGYLFPVFRYLQRTERAGNATPSARPQRVLGRMLLGACLSGVALLGTWGSLQMAPSWVDQLTKPPVIPVHSTNPSEAIAPATPSQPAAKSYAKEYTQICSSIGAILGTLLAALMGDWLGRRPAYTLLCIVSLGATYLLYQCNTEYSNFFLVSVFIAGCCTASFYGWLPLYLPELFPTAVRAVGQGFSFNFGRVLAAAGTLQVGALQSSMGFPMACTIISTVYLVGMAIIWLAPETHGKPLPE